VPPQARIFTRERGEAPSSAIEINLARKSRRSYAESFFNRNVVK
jgi:hypothetical protein